MRRTGSITKTNVRQRVETFESVRAEHPTWATQQLAESLGVGHQTIHRLALYADAPAQIREWLYADGPVNPAVVETVLDNRFIKCLAEADQVSIVRKIVDGVIQQTGAPALREMFELLSRASFATRKRWLDPEARMSPEELKTAVLDADALVLSTAREKAERARNRPLTAHDQLLYGVDTYKWLNLVDNRLNKVITHAEEILASLSVTGRGTESVIHERLREVGQRFIDTAEIMETLTGEAEARKAARERTPEPAPEEPEILIITGVVV
jgi:hypothetical protein